MDLREISIFKNLTDADIKYINDRNLVEIKTYKKDEHIFRVGQVTSDMYYLIDGSVIVYKIDPQGKRFIIKKFKKPSIFGEVYSYLGEPFDFSAAAEVDCKILLVHDFKSIFAGDPPQTLLKNYISLLSRKCLALSRTNLITSQPTLRQKIVKYLILNQEDSKVALDISREEWADTLVTTRPSLSRELSNMVNDGLIKVDDRHIEILDLQGLGQII